MAAIGGLHYARRAPFLWGASGKASREARGTYFGARPGSEEKVGATLRDGRGTQGCARPARGEAAPAAHDSAGRHYRLSRSTYGPARQAGRLFGPMGQAEKCGEATGRRAEEAGEACLPLGRRAPRGYQRRTSFRPPPGSSTYIVDRHQHTNTCIITYCKFCFRPPLARCPHEGGDGEEDPGDQGPGRRPDPPPGRPSPVPQARLVRGHAPPHEVVRHPRPRLLALGDPALRDREQDERPRRDREAARGGARLDSRRRRRGSRRPRARAISPSRSRAASGSRLWTRRTRSG